MWQVLGTADFRNWFVALANSPEGREARIEIDAVVKVLEQFGPSLGRPYVDTLKGSRIANLKELRVRTAGMVIRIAFAFDPLQQAILLIGASKTGVNQKRFYRSLIARAEELYEIHLREIKPKIEARKKGKS